MPKRLAADIQRFLRAYVKEGAQEEQIAKAEKVARIRAGRGARLLKQKRVQAELKRLMDPIVLEQQRQAMLVDAANEIHANLKKQNEALQAEIDNIKQMPKLKVNGNVDLLEHELMRLARLDPERHGRIKLASIQTAFVVAGLMEQGTTKRVLPLDTLDQTSNAGIYETVFARGTEEKPAGEVIPPAAGKDVFDLLPVAPTPVVVPEDDEPKNPIPTHNKSGNQPVITVEI